MLPRKEDQDGSTALQILERIIKKDAAKQKDVTHLESIKDIILQSQIEDSVLPDDVARGKFTYASLIFIILTHVTLDDDDGSEDPGSGSESD